MKINSLSLLFFSLLTLIVTFPLALHLNTLILDRYDGLLITWIINWNVHSFSLGLPGILNYFNANIFFPYHNTLAFSDYHFLNGLIALPFVFITGEPLVGYNINYLLGFSLTAWAMFLLIRSLTRDTRCALLCGTLFSFSMIHLSYMTHLQLFDFYPVIFATHFLLQRRFLLFLCTFILAVLTMPLNIFFLLAVVTSYFLTIKRDDKRLLLSAVVAWAVSGLLLLPYVFVSHEFNYVRPIQEVIHFSLKYPDLVRINESSRLVSFLGSQDSGTPAFFGVIFLLLLLILFWQRLRNFSLITPSPQLNFAFLLGALSFILSFGPAFHVVTHTIRAGFLPFIPMPYLILYYLLPGFSGFRTPSRWILLSAFALVIAIGIHFKRKISSVSLSFLIALILLEINLPFSYILVPTVKDFPPEQAWLKANSSGQAIIQFPIYNWADFDGVGEETLRMYYSTIHWQPMFNGYSGFFPEAWQNKVGWLRKEFPSTKTLQFLKDKQIKLILVPEGWKARMLPFNQVELIEEFPNTLIYKLQ